MARMRDRIMRGGSRSSQPTTTSCAAARQQQHAPLIAFDQMEPPPRIECQHVLHDSNPPVAGRRAMPPNLRGPAGQPDQPKHRDQGDDDGED